MKIEFDPFLDVFVPVEVVFVCIQIRIGHRAPAHNLRANVPYLMDRCCCLENDEENIYKIV
jgi:hypothetical protein